MDETRASRSAVFFTGILGSCAVTLLHAQQAPPDAAPTRVEIEQILQRTKGPLLPELSAEALEKLPSRPQGKDLLAWIQIESLDIPQTTYTLYRAFQRSGEREPYERPYFDKRERLARAVLAARLKPEDRVLGYASDLVWSICEETNWVLPAHESLAVDLFASETAADLGYVALLLGDRLPREIAVRLRREVDQRVLAVYLKDPEQFWWKGGENNWTSVCAGSIGEAALLLESDVSRQAAILEPVLRQLERFIDRAFSEDGASLEGIGYWDYGLTHYVALAEMVRSRTQGQIDLLAQPKIRRIARFPLAAALDRGRFICFADSHEDSAIPPYLAARLGEQAGQPALTSLAGSFRSHWLGVSLRNLFWWDGQRAPFQIEEAILPQAGIAKRVGLLAGRQAVLVAKAGHNDEPHNHNDIGSFILFVDGTTLLCDPGSGRYTKDYFGKNRYENVFASSLGHSVPVIDNQPQLSGRDHNGTIALEPDGTVVIRFEKAYGIPRLRSAARRLRLDESGGALLEDRFEFDGNGLPVKEVLMTWLAVETSGSTARIKSEKGTLVIEAQGATWNAERLENECRENLKKNVLTRLSATYEGKPQIQARFAMTYQPK